MCLPPMLDTLWLLLVESYGKGVLATPSDLAIQNLNGALNETIGIHPSRKRWNSRDMLSIHSVDAVVRLQD
jgi:hypothetical protein